MKPEVTTETVTTRKHTLKLTRADILAAVEKLTGEQIRFGAEVVFQVPGGGDYSNCEVYITDDAPVIVRWISSEIT